MCSNVPPATAICKAPTTDADTFVCTGTGVFPDPRDCTKYYYCTFSDTDGYKTYAYECDDQYVFDPSGPNDEYCRKSANKKLCVELACEKDRSMTTVMSYKFFPSSMGQIIGVCRADNKYPFVYRCEAGFEADLDQLPIKCEVKFTKASVFADRTDPNKYYQCALNGKIWEATLKSCLPHYIFDPNTKKCMKQK